MIGIAIAVVVCSLFLVIARDASQLLDEERRINESTKKLRGELERMNEDLRVQLLHINYYDLLVKLRIIR